MKIQKIEMTNFRHFGSFKEQLHDITEIVGSNGMGKTSIKEAILFCLYNIDNTGSGRGNETLIKDGTIMMEVTCDLGENKIKRAKNKIRSQAYIKEGKNNWETVAQRDLEVTMPGVTLFQSIFDVGYFHTMSEKEQRELILEITPDIDRNELYKETYPNNYPFVQKYNVDLSRGYDVERDSLMMLRRDLQQELKMIGSFNGFSYSDLEIRELDVEVNRLKAIYEGMKVIVCDKCNQEIKTEAKQKAQNEYQGAKAKLEFMRARVEEEKKLMEKSKLDKQAVSDKIMELTALIEDLSPSGLPSIEFDIKVKPIARYLDTLLSGITISTSRIIKAKNDWSEAFIIKYNGVEFQRLSTGEQKKVALAFSEMLDKLSGYQVGIKFVDHMESVTGDIPKVGGQLIMAKVTSEVLKVKKGETNE